MEYIKVWRFEDAPKKYQRLSKCGGDEDWIAVVPLSMYGDYIGWLESGGSFGCCGVDKFKTKDGEVYIGSHA